MEFKTGDVYFYAGETAIIGGRSVSFYGLWKSTKARSFAEIMEAIVSFKTAELGQKVALKAFNKLG